MDRIGQQLPPGASVRPVGVTAGGAFSGKEESVPQFAAKSIHCSQLADFRRATERSNDEQVSRWPPADLPPPPRLANGVGRILGFRVCFRIAFLY